MKKHEFTQEGWWVPVQYPNDVETHPKCSCGATLEARMVNSHHGVTDYRLVCPMEEKETNNDYHN